MFGKREVPVFVFTGFLESGKTTFIRETLKEGQFEDGKTMLYIVCEEGEAEIEEELINKNHLVIKTVEDEDEISEELFLKYEKEIKPARVIIECNGMWSHEEVLDALPATWVFAEGITTVDSSTFETYLNNMKMMMTNQFLYSNLVVFNRCKEDYDRAMFKRMVRAVNRQAQVLFEDMEGNVTDKCDEELPYDINAKIIEIADDDFGIFYVDAIDNLDAYKNKTVRFKAIVYHPKKARPDVFVPGRFAMTCCADDVAFVGYPCQFDKAKNLKDKEWIYVTARVGSAYSREFGQDAPVLYAESITQNADPAKEEVVYFN